MKRLSTEVERLNGKGVRSWNSAAKAVANLKLLPFFKLAWAPLTETYTTKANISKYINETSPLEYEACLIGLNAILAKRWDIANNPHSNERDKLQAISVSMQAYSMKIDLFTNATVVERAVYFVDKHRSVQGFNT